ncbi:hypothetical protein SAMN04488040_0718 [Sulfitobacter marinus]|uniref:Uncharacterized protein n=1 Tax=Sulfitobacter marinus TaxID=394264 RepID=A0A1I6QGI7_9RHOB|nr:hypothetical protein SAMN04488040_0718 [Sulfitobacter marinus]
MDGHQPLIFVCDDITNLVGKSFWHIGSKPFERVQPLRKHRVVLNIVRVEISIDCGYIAVDENGLQAIDRDVTGVLSEARNWRSAKLEGKGQTFAH